MLALRPNSPLIPTKTPFLTVKATPTDGGDAATAATNTASLHVDVTPVADTPTLSTSATSGNEDTAIALDIHSALSEVDADAVLSDRKCTRLNSSNVTTSNVDFCLNY